MPESIHRVLERFQLVRVPSLPHLFLDNPFLQAGGEPDRKLAHDPFLRLRLLGARHAFGLNSAEAATGPHGLAPEQWESLVSSAALHTGFNEPGDLQLNFYKQHWRQSAYCAFLMRALAERCAYPRVEQAGLCGQLMNCGELILENVFAGQYLDLHRQAASEEELVDLERGQFGATHSELGAALLVRWGLERGLADALRYHHEPLEDMDDAGKLAKLAWLTGRIANEEAPPVLAAQAARLLNLDERALEAVKDEASRALEEKEKGLRIRISPARRFPLDAVREEEAAALDEVARLQLRQRILDHSLFKAIRPEPVLGTGQLTAAVAAYLSLLFGLDTFALFRLDKAGQKLKAVAGQPGGRELIELEIGCAGRENASPGPVLACFREGRRLRVDPGESGTSLPVVDRQLLALLGKEKLLCEPLVVDGRSVAVLALGYNSDEINYYLDQSLTVPLFLQALSGMLVLAESGGAGSRELLHEEKIREVIHEVNNPLSIIKNYLHILALKQEENPQLVEEIGVLKTEIDRVAGILHKLRRNGGEEGHAAVDINAVVAKLARVFNSSVMKERGLDLVLRLDAELPAIHSNANALKQVITNLVMNSAEALPPGGSVTVQTQAGIYMSGRRFVEMQVSDDGPGISPEVMERLFTHANSTKGGHAGDGLAIVKTLCDRLGGRLTCRTGKQGTSFSLLLPERIGEQE